MGFCFADPVYVLEFEDEAGLVGLEVKARAQNLGTFLDMTALATIGDTPTGEDIAKMHALLDGFADVLESWNVERPGPDGEMVPVPPTVEGLRSLKFGDVFKIITAWIKVTAGVPGPLGEASSGGAPSEVPLPPMAPLSTSRAS